MSSLEPLAAACEELNKRLDDVEAYFTTLPYHVNASAPLPIGTGAPRKWLLEWRKAETWGLYAVNDTGESTPIKSAPLVVRIHATEVLGALLAQMHERATSLMGQVEGASARAYDFLAARGARR